MDNRKIGDLIRTLRTAQKQTQLQLAQQLHVSDRTVSKWERGLGCPELTLLPDLSRILGVDMESLLSGELNKNPSSGGNVRKMRFYVCPECGNVITSMETSVVICCGRKMEALTPVKASEDQKLNIETVEHDFYITTSHEMNKQHYITFVAMLTSDSMILKKLYPEWDLQVRFPAYFRGRLIWYCSQHGLFYQEIRR